MAYDTNRTEREKMGGEYRDTDRYRDEHAQRHQGELINVLFIQK
jgi:hypothetical protein